MTLRDSLTINQKEASTDILYRDLILMRLTDEDAAPLRQSRLEAARQYKARIDAALDRGIQINSWQQLAISRDKPD